VPPAGAERARARRVARELSGEIRDGATVTLDAEGEELAVRWSRPDGDRPAAEAVEVPA